MRKTLLTIFIFIFGIPLLAQDIHFPSAIVAAGGSSEGGSATLTRWRLAPIHVITLQSDKMKVKNPLQEESIADWSVSLYPNPTEDFLYLEFQIEVERELILKIADASGRVMYIQEARSFSNGSNLVLNVSRYNPGLYLLQITSKDLKSQQIFRVQKL